MIGFSGGSGAGWCPSVQVTPDFVWRDKAQLEIAGKVWINIDGTAKDALADAARKIPQALDCNQFKGTVAPLWHAYSVPINSGNAKEVLGYMNLTPKTAGFSGLTYQADGLKTAIALGASTEVSTTQLSATNQPIPLPALRRVPATSNKLNLVVPLRAEYSDLQNALTHIVSGQDYSADTPAGVTHVRIKQVTVYPADKQLVVVMQFSAHSQQRIGDVNGWVYLAAEPKLDQAAQSFRLTNISFTRHLDSKLWSVVSAVFSGPIQTAFEQRASIDLKDSIAALRIRVKSDLATEASKQGINIALNDSFVGLKQINVREKMIEVVVGLEGTADVTATQIVK